VQEQTGPEPIDLVWHVAVEERNHSTDLAQARHLPQTNTHSDKVRTWHKPTSHLQVDAT